MRLFDPVLLDLLDEGRTDVAGMIRFDLGEGSFGFIHRSWPYVWGGVTFDPLPEGILQITDLPSGTGTAAEGFAIELSESPDNGLTPAVIVQIESYDYRDRPVRVFDLHMHPDTGAVLGDPLPQARGYINAIEHVEDPQRGYIARIECETGAIDYSRSNGRLRTHADQQRRAPGDLGLEHASTAGRVKLNWGRT